MQNWFFEAIKRWDRKKALQLPGAREALTFKELSEAVRGVALPPRGTVATQMPLSLQQVMILYAAMSVNRPFCPISPRISRRQAVELAQRIGAEVLITPEESIALEKRFEVDLQSGDSVIFTSGSSGAPKAVVIPLAAHLANARGAASLLSLEPDDTWSLALPLHHVSGLSILYRCLDRGARVSLDMTDRKATHLSLVSTQLKRLLDSRSPWAGLKAVLVGGGPVALDLVNTAIAAGCPLHLTYGMTETASQITTTERLTSALLECHAGKPLPGRKVSIDAEGVLYVGGEVLARGILNPDGSVQPLTNSAHGLYCTGDLGRWDANGNLVVTGRLDRMFISGGENIHPEQIEQTLLSLPGVDLAVVVPRKHTEFGFRPVAYILGNADLDALRKALAESLPGYLCPEEILPWPKGIEIPTGKISKMTMERLAESFCDAQKSR